MKGVDHHNTKAKYKPFYKPLTPLRVGGGKGLGLKLIFSRKFLCCISIQKGVMLHIKLKRMVSR